MPMPMPMLNQQCSNVEVGMAMIKFANDYKMVEHVLVEDPFKFVNDCKMVETKSYENLPETSISLDCPLTIRWGWGGTARSRH